MKTIFSYAMVLAFSIFMVSQASAQTKSVTEAQLPASAQEFVKKHFAGEKIEQAWEDKETFSTDYKVRLANGTEIEFDGKGNWDEIDGNRNAVPASLIPDKIADYIRTNYKDLSARQIDKKRSGYEVELSNGTELEFDSNGKFLRIDK